MYHHNHIFATTLDFTSILIMVFWEMQNIFIACLFWIRLSITYSTYKKEGGIALYFIFSNYLPIPHKRQ